MSFFNKLKRAFGFNDIGEDIDDVVDYDMSRSPWANPFKRNDHPRADLYENVDEPTDEPAVTPTPQPAKEFHDPEPMPAQPVEEKTIEEPAAPAKATTEATQQPQDNEEDNNAATPQPQEERPTPEVSQPDDIVIEPKTEQEEAPQEAQEAKETTMYAPLVDTVVSLINASLPPAMKQYIDCDGQRRDVEKALEPHLEHIVRQATPVESVVGLKELLKTSDMQRRAACQRADDLSEQLKKAQEELKIAEELATRIDEIEKFKESKNEENRTLRARIVQLEQDGNDVDHMKAELQLVTEENARLKKEVDTLSRSNRETSDKQKRRDVELANRINDLKSQVSKAATLAESYKDNLDLQLKAVDDLQAKLDAATSDKQSSDKALARAKDELKAARKENSKHIKEMTKELEAMRKHNEQLQGEIEELKASRVVEETPAAQEAPVVEKPEVANEAPTIEEIPVVETAPVADEVPVIETTPVVTPAIQEKTEERGIGITLDDIDDVDWLIPVEPDKAPEPEPEPEPQPLPKPKSDPRQLTLW